jgi:hypothetical protein
VGGVPGLPEEASSGCSAGRRRHRAAPPDAAAVAVGTVVRQLRHGWLRPGRRGHQLATHGHKGRPAGYGHAASDAASTKPSYHQGTTMRRPFLACFHKFVSLYFFHPPFF